MNIDVSIEYDEIGYRTIGVVNTKTDQCIYVRQLPIGCVPQQNREIQRVIGECVVELIQLQKKYPTPYDYNGGNHG